MMKIQIDDYHLPVAIISNSESFVGIRINDEGVFVSFPEGFDVAEDSQVIKQQILSLLNILVTFSNLHESLLPQLLISNDSYSLMPVTSFLYLIQDFLSYKTYYKNEQKILTKNGNGKINFKETLRKSKFLLQNDNSPYFYSYVTSKLERKDDEIITEVHKYCVYIAFSMLGWLVTSYKPQKPLVKIDAKVSLLLLKQKLNQVNNDRDKFLIHAMINVLQNKDINSKGNYYFGTKRFEYVWEKMIRSVYSITNISEYLPRCQWQLHDKTSNTASLRPDSIMLVNQDIFILDAKYYRYGITGCSNDLPGNSDISKQIIYGEYAFNHFPDKSIYNAFILPYNKHNNNFSSSKTFFNLGQGVCFWKQDLKYPYLKVQGVLLDMKDLFYMAKHPNPKYKEFLSTFIKKSYIQNNIFNDNAPDQV